MIRHLGLFAKYWEPGKVKTRLSAVGPDSVKPAFASQIYYQFLDHLLTELKTVGSQRSLLFSPPHRRTEFEIISQGWTLQAQSEGNLGNRMSNFFRDAFLPLECHQLTSNADSKDLIRSNRVIVIGSDTPLLSPADIENAFDQLQTHDVVIGPGSDGGYYLIGMNHYHPNLFENISWSTAEVLSQTLDRIEHSGISCHLLPTMTDIDNPQDLQWLLRELERTRQVPSSQRLLSRLSFLSLPGKWNG